MCREYIELRRLVGMADGTILKDINVVRQALNWRSVTGAQFEAPGAPPPRDRYLTKDEFRTLLEAASEPLI